MLVSLLLAAATLASPIPDQPALTMRAPRDLPCPRAPPALANLAGVRMYKDDRYSIVDPAAKARDAAAAAPLTQLLGAVADQTAEYRSTGGKNADAGRCALALIDAWARPQALLGALNEQGRQRRIWALNALATDYLVVRGASTDASQRRRIETWFSRLAAEVRVDGQAYRNNHRYWAIAATASAAVAVNDRPAFDQAMDQARDVLGDITADGLLPLELRRGRQAMTYHVFALQALVVTAEMARANGVDLYANGALDRLADTVIANMENPAAMARAAGAEQDWAGPKPSSLAWAEPYYRHRPSARLAAWIGAHRPLRQDAMGGNVTVLYGVRLKP